MKKILLLVLAVAALLTTGTVYAAQTKVSAIKPSVGSSTMPMMRGYATQTPPVAQPYGSYMQRGNMMYYGQPTGGQNAWQMSNLSRGAMSTGASLFVLFVITTVILWVLMLLAIVALFKWIKKQE